MGLEGTSSDNLGMGPDRPELDFLDGLIAEYHFKTVKDNDEMWYYDRRIGIFFPRGEYIIKELLQLEYGRELSNRQVTESLGQIQRSTYIHRDAFNPAMEWLATKNCMVNLLTGETKPFSPDFLCTTHIPVVYDYGLRLRNISRLLQIS